MQSSNSSPHPSMMSALHTMGHAGQIVSLSNDYVATAFNLGRYFSRFYLKSLKECTMKPRRHAHLATTLATGKMWPLAPSFDHNLVSDFKMIYCCTKSILSEVASYFSQSTKPILFLKTFTKLTKKSLALLAFGSDIPRLHIICTRGVKPAPARINNDLRFQWPSSMPFAPR